MTTTAGAEGAVRRLTRASLLATVALLLVAACGGTSDDDASSSREPEGGQRFPDVVDVNVERAGAGYDFEVTISSPYDSPARYADGWRVAGLDGTVHGEHTLAHDHAGEQPFTRTQRGVTIPDGVGEVVVEGHDSRHGYGGRTITVPLPDA